jgi:signal transduction histidine kinase
MDFSSILTRAMFALNYILLGLLLVLAVLWAAWFLGKWSAHRERRSADALGAVMQATTLRRSLQETMGRLLESTTSGLNADSAALHVLDESDGNFKLFYTVGIVQLARLVNIPPDDPLRAHLEADRDGVVTGVVDDFGSPWAALAHGPTLALAAARIEGWRDRKPQGMITLGWSSSQAAHANRLALLNISRYARQVLGEFEEIEQRARDIQSLSAELQRQEALARTAAHDLLNKLTFAYGTVSTLLAEGRVPIPDRESVERALAQITLVNQMLEDLRDPDRPIQPQRVRVEDLVELAAGMMVPYQANALVDFALDVPPGLPDVWGERVEILRVLDNLLTNAVRHNTDCLPVRIWLRARRAGGEVEFEVGDSGGGITPDVHEHLFELGFRMDSAGRVLGHGMGLWSCRRIVEAHGGCIWVEGQPGEGARFFFTLPVAPEVVGGSQSEDQPLDHSQSKLQACDVGRRTEQEVMA